jgi:hypothetical protein
VRKLTKEKIEAGRQQFADDEKAASALLASPGGEVLIRFLEVLWLRRGLAETAENTSYRVALRDAIDELKDIRKEGGA